MQSNIHANFMKKRLLVLWITFFTVLGFSQEKVTVSGKVIDSNNNETLIGVLVAIPQLNISTFTNEYGFFSLTVPTGSYEIQASTIGYVTTTTRISLLENSKITLEISANTKELEAVVVSKNPYRMNIHKPEMSVNKIALSTIKKMPAILGEIDILKSITTLPGVTNAGEGQSGFNVRGGAADQNLILLDEATVFNSSHLFGFFSIFNADAIKDLKLYKGGIPARFGGRVASVLDIYQKEGNSKSFNVTGGIGLISSRLMAEGPLVKDKGSFLVAGRSSYAHLFLKLTDNKNSAYFYDLNTKLSYKLNDNNNLYLSGYFGRDVFSLNNNFINTYGNTVFNLRWNHLFSGELYVE